MKISKRVRLILLGVIVALGLVGGTQQTAQAATWHKGTPTALRGTWNSKSKYVAHTRVWTSVIMKPTRFTLTHGFGDPLVTTNAYYHHKIGSRYYYLKATEKQALPEYVNVHYIYFYKVGHKLKYRDYNFSQNGRFYPGKSAYSEVFTKAK